VTASGKKLPTMLIFKNLVNIPQLPKEQSWPKGIILKKIQYTSNNAFGMAEANREVLLVIFDLTTCG
jgi:hypothetical protein